MAVEQDNDKLDGKFILQLLSISIATLFLVRAVFYFISDDNTQLPKEIIILPTDSVTWTVPNISILDDSEESKKIRYGHDLIANTALYLGQQGCVNHISNGMNCQNCHLDAGTKIWGNNYSAVASTYPKFRERSGSIESVYKRVNDCLERSLNGSALDTSSDEMQAIRAYILWLGKDIPTGKKVRGVGITDMAYMDRAADTAMGRIVYTKKCQSCHKDNGEGVLNANGISYQYPPLWGAHSYNNGAGLFRLSRLAGYVKSNMPFGANYNTPQLSDEEAWDVAAYINSRPRPSKDLRKDWPRIAAKPVDHPYGPYADTFSESQHKFGPFAPIAAFKKNQSKSK